MHLETHIAHRFLTDDSLIMDIIGEFHPGYEKREMTDEVALLFDLLSRDDQKAYYITNTVLEKLEMLKIKKRKLEGGEERFDWTVFKKLTDRKVTFIFPDNALLRLRILGGMLYFCHMMFEHGKIKNHGTATWVIFHIDRFTGEVCQHYGSSDVQALDTFIYSLLCFMYLTENDEVVVDPKTKYGTRKSGKLINTLPIPVTMVNSRWNTTVINTTGFPVAGHFRLQPCGPGLTDVKLILIDPFVKDGYVRSAKSLNEEV